MAVRGGKGVGRWSGGGGGVKECATIGGGVIDSQPSVFYKFRISTLTYAYICTMRLLYITRCNG